MKCLFLTVIFVVSIASTSLALDEEWLKSQTHKYPAPGAYSARESTLADLPKNVKNTHIKATEKIHNATLPIYLAEVGRIRNVIETQWGSLSDEQKLDYELSHRWLWDAILRVYYQSGDANLKKRVVASWRKSLTKESKANASQLYALRPFLPTSSIQPKNVPLRLKWLSTIYPEDKTFINDVVWDLYDKTEDLAVAATVAYLVSWRGIEEEYAHLKKRLEKYGDYRESISSAFLYKRALDARKKNPNLIGTGYSFPIRGKAMFAIEVEREQAEKKQAKEK